VSYAFLHVSRRFIKPVQRVLTVQLDLPFEDEVAWRDAAMGVVIAAARQVIVWKADSGQEEDLRTNFRPGRERPGADLNIDASRYTDTDGVNILMIRVSGRTLKW
jgi:hypothetical protein